jgi:hypothetical protein
MTQRKLDREEYRRKKRNGRIVYPENLQEEPFHSWFKSEVSRAKAAGEEIDEDVLVLSLPPSSQATSYRSMYAFGNHIRVRSAEGTLTTCDCGVAATFSQNCRSSVRAKTMKAVNLEYVGWVEEILAVDYGRYELVVLYCNWVMANMVGHNATMKRDEYGFSLVNFDRLVPLSAESFAFPLHVEQVFFADDLNNHGWKVVLRKEPRGARVVSNKDYMPDIGCLSLGNVEEHCGLVPASLDDDATPTDPILDEVVVLSSNEVVVALNTNEHESPFEDEDDFEIEEDRNVQID